jgi:ankyrin repeat protein
MRGNVQLASHVLKEGFDISDSGGSEFVTPLYKAAECGQMDMVIFLIEKSADVNLGGVHKFNKFETPLSIAAEEGHPDVVRFLLTKLAKYNENLPDEIPTPFYKALLNGHTDVVDILLKIHKC